MYPSQQKKQNTPYSWQAGDTSTFAQQAQNLGNQVGNQGLNTGIVDVQQQTAQAQQKAAQSAQNAAQGTSEVAKGATVDPTVAQSSSGNPQIAPYKVTKEAPAAPDTTVANNNADFSKNSTYQDPTEQYLNSIFPDGIPQSVQDALNKEFQPKTPAIINPVKGIYEPAVNSDYAGLSNDYQDYLNQLQKYERSGATKPQDLQSYQNALANQLQKQIQTIDQQYQTGQTDLATQNSSKQKAISDYINQLQTGLKDYQTNTQDLGNTGQLSDVEKASADVNGVLAGPGVTGTAALSALSHGPVDSRTAALSQQAQNAAIQEAEGKAGANQEAAKTSAEMQAEGQKSLNKSYADAKDTISKNQETSFNKLKDSSDAAQQALTDAYNKSKSNLTSQEQEYVNKAQDTLKNANVPETSIKDATAAFADSIQNYISKGNLTQGQKDNLKTQLESIWRIAVGTNKSDINFSNEISNILLPIAQSIGEKINAPS